jgi:Tfp pilus assembly protein FimV
VLQAGDTLWDVAGKYAPQSVDTRAYVDALLEINHVTGAPSAGMRLKLPR